MVGGLQLKVFLAGRVAVEIDGVVIDEARFPGRQGRLLFAYLVAEQGRAVPRDELAEALWAEAPPATWDKALTVIVSKLRGLLAEPGIDRANVLTSAFGCYRLDLPEGSWVDVSVAANAAVEAEEALAAGDLERAKAAAALGASLLRRPFLPAEEGAWVEEKRRELTDVRGRALSTLADACLRSGDAPEAAKWAEQTIALAPFRETGYRLLMGAHAAAGNRAEALRVYERCRRLLAEELGAYPSPETEAIYRGLLEAPAAAARPVAAPESSLADVASPAPVERQSGAAFARVALRKRVGAAAVLLGATAAVIGFVATRSGTTHPTAITANAVGLIDARGDRIRAQVSVDAAPTSVAFGDDAVWVTNAYANTMSRIDPRTRSVRQTITVGASPSGIAVGGGGVWVANHDDGTVSWINPQSNTVVEETRVGDGPTAVAVGFGSVWVTNSDNRTVSRIDPDTGVVVATIPTGAVGRGIAVGAGSVWVTDEASRTVARIDPATNRVTGNATVGSGPAGIVYGRGALWIANDLDDTVSEIDPTTMAVRAAIPVAGSPSALAFRDGALWVSAEFGQRLVKIDARTLRTLAIPIDNRPTGLAAGPSGVWVAVQASGRGHYGGRLVVVSDGFDSIDPALANFTNSFALLGAAYDGLVAFRRAGGSEGTQLVPDLAISLPLPTDGGRSYTFTIRPGIRYSDGTPLRAEDLRRALERMLTVGSPQLESYPALAKVVGASRCTPKRRCDLSRGVIVNGAHSLTFRLSTPDRRFLLSLTSLVPVPAGTPPRDVGTRPIPSTGSYKIESYVPGQTLKLVRNRYFRSWSDAARPNGYPDEIVWRIVSQARAMREVIDGRADVDFNRVPADRVEALAARYPHQLHLVPQRATTFVFLNTRRAPFDDIRVRRAVNYAIDRRKVAELHGGTAVALPTCQAVPPTVPGYRRHCPYTVDADASADWKAPDLAKARALVAASSTKGEKVVVWTFPYFGNEGRYFVSLLRRLGYRAQLKEISDGGRYFPALERTPSVQAGFGGWFGEVVAADTFETLKCHFADNWARFCDPRLDAQVRRLALEEASDPTAGAALAAKIDREIVDQAPWVPLFTPRFADFVSSRVGNYQANTYASSTVLLDQLWVR
jgi:YVTN family beta-propeller protein